VAARPPARRAPSPATILLALAGHALAAAAVRAALAGWGPPAAEAGCGGAEGRQVPSLLFLLTSLTDAAAAAALLAWVPPGRGGRLAAALHLWSGALPGGGAAVAARGASAVAAAAAAGGRPRAAVVASAAALAASLASPLPGIGACIGAVPAGSGGPLPYALALAPQPAAAWAGAALGAAATGAACAAALARGGHAVGAAWAGPTVAGLLSPSGGGWGGAAAAAALVPVVLPGQRAVPSPALAGAVWAAAAGALATARPLPWDTAGLNLRWGVRLVGLVVQGLGVVAVVDGVVVGGGG